MTQPAVSFEDLASLLEAAKVAAATTAPKPVHVPEMGGTVYVASLSTTEWLDPSDSEGLPKDATEAQRRGWSVARWVCDAQGTRLVSPTNLAALGVFGALPWQASHRILVAAGVMHEGEPKNG